MNLENYCNKCTSKKSCLQYCVPDVLHTVQQDYVLKSVADNAYSERNKLVAFLSRLYPSYLAKHEVEDTSWDDDWRNIVVVESLKGQLSWHIHDTELSLFEHLEYNENYKWDGHTTEEKYARLAQLPVVPSKEE